VIGRVVGLLTSFAVGAFLVTLAVANRHGVRLVLDPFNPQNPVLALELPFYAYLFAMLIVGVVVGGWASWLGQSKWRRAARTRTQDALRWKAEAERLGRERDANVTARKQLVLAGR